MKTGSGSEIHQVLIKYYQDRLLSTSKKREIHRELSCLKQPKSWKWTDILFRTVRMVQGFPPAIMSVIPDFFPRTQLLKYPPTLRAVHNTCTWQVPILVTALSLLVIKLLLTGFLEEVGALS